MVQVRNRVGTYMTILRLFEHGTAEIPGNIFQQQAVWGISDQDATELMTSVKRRFRRSTASRMAAISNYSSPTDSIR